jgi:hypothetical protein
MGRRRSERRSFANRRSARRYRLELRRLRFENELIPPIPQRKRRGNRRQTLNLDELLKTLHTQEFWQERGNFIGDLSGGKMNVIFDQILFKQFVPERKSGYIKRADRKFSDWLDAFELIGDEVARYSVALEPDPNHYDKITRVDFPSASRALILSKLPRRAVTKTPLSSGFTTSSLLTSGSRKASAAWRSTP